MDNLITAFLALGLVAVFLLVLAFSIDAIPFFLIVAIVLAFTLIDFLRSTRRPSNGSDA